MFYIYILRCGDNSLYTGITTDLARRLAEHRGQGGRGARYTASRQPLSLAAAWSAPNRSAALRLEAKLKALPKAKKENLLQGYLPPDWDTYLYPPVPLSPTLSS